MKLPVLIVGICFLIGTTNSLTYQIFGTKRFNRGIGSQRAEMAPQHVIQQPVYENGYLTNNGYYYYPHHEYHAYGMPTYQGEYKPKAYYYSAGPSYNYYNDREPVSNPLDDLHEEILQENEQERQSDLLQRDDYDDDYYIDPNERLHDQETTNNFLRNMMEYNRQNEKQQRMQQLHYRQRDQFDQVPIHKDDDYFSEMEVNPDDYQYEPQGEDNFDLQKYWDAELLSMNNNKGANTNEYHHRRELENPYQQPNNDQDVEDLKSLSKHEPEYYEEDYKKRYHNKDKQSNANSWSNSKTSVVPALAPKQKEFEDDYSPVDYDDGSWINWDRKRSSLRSQSHGRIQNKFEPSAEAHKRVPSIPQQSAKPLPLMSTTTEPSIATYGQKEKYPMDESYAASVLDQKNEENAKNKQNFSKNAKAMEKNIYDTIRQMITIEQDLKKNGSNMQKRNTKYGGSVVKELDSLKKH